MTDTKKDSTNTKLENFIFKNRKAIIAVACVAIVAAVVVCVVVGISDAQTKKGLDAIDQIEFTYTAKSISISDSEISARQDKAIADVAPLCEKNGIVGVRANMLAADVYYAKKDYSSALNAYLAAADKGKKIYTASICKYNAAVCSEELGNKEEAVKYFVASAEDKDFLLSAHALFNAARIQESLGLLNEAAENYKKVVDGYNNDTWASLSQSRIIDLQAKGKID
ncbi:tetratricopeptide repeat protein [Treponema sp.]|uniref:tetratricopeptide repeat protein n=1 Tax=Treponema sp. TaxID=166 RepID=UPI0038900189